MKQKSSRDTAFCLALHGLLSLFSYIIQDHLSRSSTTHSGLRSPTSIVNQEKVPQVLLQANLGVGFSQFDGLSFKLTLAWVTLTIN